MNALWQDLRYALRTLNKDKGFTLVAVLTLALGIGANTAIFSIINSVFIRPLPFPQANRIYLVRRTGNRIGGRSISFPIFLAWQKQRGFFDHLGLVHWTGPSTLTGFGEPERLASLSVSTELFSALGVRPEQGRDFLPEEGLPGGPRVVILSNALWQSRFAADPNMVGRSLTLGGESYLVVGILPHGFELPLANTRDAQIWFPIQMPAGSQNPSNGVWCLGLLKQGVRTAQAEAALTPSLAELSQQFPKMIGAKEQAHLEPLRNYVTARAGSAPLLLFGAVAFLLLIACANVANLVLARAAARAKEIAIRTALGAGRGRILRQLLTESILLSLLGGALGAGLCYLSFDLILALVPANLLHIGAIRIDTQVLLFAFLASVVTGAAFGLVPALDASRLDLNHALKEASPQSGGARHGWLRSALVSSEVGLALVLLIGAALLIESFARLVRVPPGFDPRNLLTFQISLPAKGYDSPEKKSAFFEATLHRISVLPGIGQVALANIPPLQGGPDLLFSIERAPGSASEENSHDAEFRIISPGYFRTLRIAVERGRDFTDADIRSAKPVAIINQTMAGQFWPSQDPIGQQVWIGKPMGPAWTEPAPREIVGIVKDIREESLAAAPIPTMYIPYGQKLGRMDEVFFIARTTGAPAAFVPALRGVVNSIDPNLPLSSIQTMEGIVSESLGDSRFHTILLSTFGFLALLIATIGVYGVIAYSVAQRTHEVGIRVALGAQQQDVLLLILVHGARLALAGVAAGIVAAFALTRLMENLLFGVSATDPLTFAGVAILLTLAAFTACYIPARRAARVDPLVALRYE